MTDFIYLIGAVVFILLLVTIYSCCVASGRASDMEEREGRKR